MNKFLTKNLSKLNIKYFNSSDLKKTHNLFTLKNYKYCVKDSIGDHNNYTFIKPTTEIKDLKYKEEILEYFAFNYLNLQEADYKQILRLLKVHKILAPEIKDIKCFFRDFLEISENIKDEELISNFIYFFIDKMNEINVHKKKNTITTEIENNFYDLDFTSVLNSFFFFLERIIPKIKNPITFDAIFCALDTFPFDNFQRSNQFWVNFLKAYYNNEEVYLTKSDLNSSCRYLGFVLKAFSQQRIQELKKVKYMLNNFSMKYFENIGNIKDLIENEYLEEFKVLFYYLNEVLNKNENCHLSIKNELTLLNDDLKDKMFVNFIEREKFIRNYKEKLNFENIEEEEEI